MMFGCPKEGSKVRLRGSTEVGFLVGYEVEDGRVMATVDWGVYTCEVNPYDLEVVDADVEKVKNYLG